MSLECLLGFHQRLQLLLFLYQKYLLPNANMAYHVFLHECQWRNVSIESYYRQNL